MPLCIVCYLYAVLTVSHDSRLNMYVLRFTLLLWLHLLICSTCTRISVCICI